ncbi:MAG: histidine triad nucleotide-binding protein [Nitrospirota bacterium]
MEENDCLFCKIVNKTIPSKLEYEDGLTIAFNDITPQAPGHLLVVPKRHIRSLSDAKEEDKALLGHLLWVVSMLGAKKGGADSGFRTVINSGASAGQSVFHLHIHLLSGRPFYWPPG